MADLQLDLNENVPAAKRSDMGAGEPHFLLDDLVERKLSTLLAGGEDPSPGLRRVEDDALRA